MNKPLAKAILFTLGNRAYAWIVTSTVDTWKYTDISSNADHNSVEWAEAAFLACIVSFRELQKAYPEMDIVAGCDKSPIGRTLRRFPL